MKSLVLIAISLLVVGSAEAQNLKDLLYGGKLKSDSGSVVRKTDDLSTKIDTSPRKPPPPPPPMEVRKQVVDSATGATVEVMVPVDSATAATVPNGKADNNTLWKNFIEELNTAIRTDVMPSKKIKDGVYSVLIDYEIGLEGEIIVKSVSSDPANSFLEEQIKERITLTAPKMNPVLLPNGKPRKATKKQMLSYNK